MTRPRLARSSLGAVFALLLAFVLGCSGVLEGLEPVPPPSSTWVGRWEGPGMTLDIAADGHVVVQDTTEGASMISAPARSWDNGAMVLNALAMDLTYRVDEAPYERDGVWHMVVDGIPMERTSSAIEDHEEDTDLPAARSPAAGDTPEDGLTPSPTPPDDNE